MGVSKIASLAAGLAAFAGGQASAKTFLVNSQADEMSPGGICSVWEAVESASQDANTDWGCGLRDANPSVVKIPAGIYDMTVLSNPMESNRSVEIAGAGMGKTVLKTFAPWAFAFSPVDRGITVNLHDLTMDGGFNPDQIGIWVKGFEGPGTRTVDLTVKNVEIFGYSERAIENRVGKVTVDHCQIIDNSMGDDEEGGGILNSGMNQAGGGTMTIRRSFIGWNSAENGGGGIVNMGKLTVEHSTIGGNAAGGGSAPVIAGGGILSKDVEFPGNGTASLTLKHVTVAENWADGEGGGVEIDPQATALSVSTTNSIFTLNEDGAGGQDFKGRSGSNVSGNGPNLITRSSASQLKSGVDLIGLDANLGELADWGGKSSTYPLLPGSMAIDKANGSESSDQRDYFRPVNGGGGTAARDLGAYEHDPALQTETARLVTKSSDTHETISNSSFSNGKGTRLLANAANDFVQYAVPVTEPGTYSVRVRGQKGPDRGKYQLQYENDDGALVNLGTSKDLYASGTSMSESTIGTLTFTWAGMREFRFKVTGKNSSSSSYRLYLDCIKLVKQ
jgi:hypothetical protein